MTGTGYVNIIKENLMESVEKRRLGENFILVQDSDRKRTS